MPAHSTGGDALSRTLRELRDAAGASGLTQTEAAARAGCSQSLIARFESGRLMPRPEQVETLCAIYRASLADTRRVVQMARDARPGTEWVVMHRDVAAAQSRINRLAEAVTVERTFSPSGLPGLLQTAAYARALFRAEPNLTSEAADEALAARLAGQSLLNSDRRYGFLVPEGALGWALLPPAAMAEQIDHLVPFTDRPNIELGIIPWGHPVPALPLNSFTLFDDRLVLVGTTTRVAYLTARADLDAYHRMYDRLASLAVFGDQARALLRVAADRYRTR